MMMFVGACHAIVSFIFDFDVVCDEVIGSLKIKINTSLLYFKMIDKEAKGRWF
jgi:hypothetical protein